MTDDSGAQIHVVAFRRVAFALRSSCALRHGVEHVLLPKDPRRLTCVSAVYNSKVKAAIVLRGKSYYVISLPLSRSPTLCGLLRSIPPIPSGDGRGKKVIGSIGSTQSWRNTSRRL